MRPGEEAGESVLGHVGVLELVDEQVTVAVVVLGLHLG